MSISLKIVSYHRHTPGQQEIFKADSDSFTIGRNDENDWAIPDPQRFLSGVHCRIHVDSGRYYLTDISTNGVFMNGAESRMDRDSTVAVQNQDRFRIGDYEFEVLLEENNISVAEEDEEPFDDMATIVGQGQPEDSFEDDFEDPFSDPVPQQSRTTNSGDDDFEKDINTPLHQIDSNPISNAVSIESLLDLDDLEEEEDPDTAASLRARHNPLNDAFKASKHVASHSKPAPSVNIESNLPTDIPDDWDETTGMLKVPAASTEENNSETDDELSGFSSVDALFDESEFDESGFDETSSDEPEPDKTHSDKPIDLPDDWEDALDIFDSPAEIGSSEKIDNPDDRSPPPPPKPAEKARAISPESKAATNVPAEMPDETSVEAPAEVTTEAKPQPKPTTDRPATSSRSAGALASFMAGAGLTADDISGIDEQVFFEQLGSMMAEFTTGLVQTLSGRTHIKSEFRLDQTMIRPVENNPLKFSTSASSTLQQLLTQKDTAYMTGVTAIKEGFDDVNAHQMAVIAGMEAALQDILKRFNPEALEERLESDSIWDNIIPGGKKAKYWEMFKILFDQIAGEAEDDFQQLFGSKFSRAYEQQLDRLKNNH